MKHDQDGNGVVSRSERARWVERYRASGLGLKRFAAEYGLPPGRLHYWVYAPPASPSPAGVAPVFQEVRLTGSLERSVGWVAEVGWPGGLTMRLREGTDAAWVGALVQALGGTCSP